MAILSIDIETYSKVDLRSCGVYAYTEDDDFEILLFGYAFDDEEVKVIDLKNGERLPSHVEAALSSPSIIKTAFNANFERVCIKAYFKIDTIPSQWRCTAVSALELGLPGSLDGASRSLNLENGKMAEGKALIRYFSMPCKGTKANGFRSRNLPDDNVDKWSTFKTYCGKDVEVERHIRNYLDRYEIHESEQKLWRLDQEINDEGVRVNLDLINNALLCYFDYEERLKEEAEAFMGIKNPKSAAQVKGWIFETLGVQVDTLSKDFTRELLERTDDPKIRRGLELRLELSKTSIKKYEAMNRSLCRDNRIRGLFRFYGASRTGRWAGRLVQVQNLPQNKMSDLDLGRNLLMEGDYKSLELLFSSVTEVLSQLIRTAFIPSYNSRFIVADFSAIEARVIAWLAGESWRMEVFKSHGKIYEASVSKMFKVPLESVTKGSVLRQKGKIAELALGYQGSKGALIAMGALNMGLLEEELPGLVSAFRGSNSKIVQLWKDVERAAITAVKDKVVVKLQYGVEFFVSSGILFIRLPSGRKLAYASPRIEIDKNYNKPVLTYEGVNQETKQWGRLKTYGGKLVENIVQAIARDCLGVSMLRLRDEGYKIVMHVHDEVVLDVEHGFGSLDNVGSIMAMQIPWAKGLELRAEAFESNYYKKD